MIVWLLEHRNNKEYTLYGVFSSKEKAIECILKSKQDVEDNDWWGIYNDEIDNPDFIFSNKFKVELYARDGILKEETE